VTLYTASLCALLFLLLSWRAARYRRALGVPLGDGKDIRLLARMRAQANFAEYVPLTLVLMGLIEFRTGAVLPLWGAGAVLFGSRIAHAIGTDTLRSGGWRDIGTIGQWLVLAGLALWGMWLCLAPPPMV
jgi:uncharacterized membrane protein YecN with MAPEG domain